MCHQAQLIILESFFNKECQTSVNSFAQYIFKLGNCNFIISSSTTPVNSYNGEHLFFDVDRQWGEIIKSVNLPYKLIVFIFRPVSATEIIILKPDRASCTIVQNPRQKWNKCCVTIIKKRIKSYLFIFMCEKLRQLKKVITESSYFSNILNSLNSEKILKH